METAAGGFKNQTAGGVKSVARGVKSVARGVKGGVKGGVKSASRGVARGVSSVRKGAASTWSAVDRMSNSGVKYVTGGKLTTQGTVALVCYAVMLVTAAASPLVAAKMGLSASGGVAAMVAVSVSAAFSVYGINCMVVGGCRRLSWLYVAVLLLWTVGVVGGTAYVRYGGISRVPQIPFADDRLHPDPLADAPISVSAPALHRPGQPAVASAAEIAAGTNAIVNTQKANLYEGYDAQGAEEGAPTPFVDGEHAAAA